VPTRSVLLLRCCFSLLSGACCGGGSFFRSFAFLLPAALGAGVGASLFPLLLTLLDGGLDVTRIADRVHRHNDVSDFKISNLVEPATVRPVTVSAISLHFGKLIVRFLEVPDVFVLLRGRSASRMANSFSSRTDR